MHLSSTSEISKSQNLHCGKMSQKDALLQKKLISSLSHRSVQRTVLIIYRIWLWSKIRIITVPLCITVPYRITVHCTVYRTGTTLIKTLVSA